MQIWSVFFLTTFATLRMDFLQSECLRKKSVLIITFHLSVLCVKLSLKRRVGLGIQRSAWGLGSWRGGQLAGYGGSLISQPEQQQRSCLLPSIMIFSSISSVPCMCTGLLFLTSISYTDPDQFVYKTRPPREQPDTSPDVMMNSYLGLWPLRWQINCLGHGHLKIFLIHTEHKSFYFLFHFKWSTHKKHAIGWGSAARWFSELDSIISPYSKLMAHHIFQLTIWELQR